MKSLFALTILPSAVLAASRTSAPSGCVTVSSSGGDFSTIQAAVDSDPTCIFIAPGTYNEQVLVNQRSASQFSIYGSTSDDTSSAGNTVTITSSLSQADGLSNDETATLRVKTSGFRLYNVNVENAYGEGSQAVALSAYSDSGFYGCALTGFQDTLLANQGNQIYVATTITGATDFIFGQLAVAWFQDCDIQCVDKSIGYVTAHGREEENSSVYVFDSCSVGGDAPSGAYYLGRPWREYAHVVFQNSELSDVINSAGWHIWNDDDPRTSNVVFAEYGNTGTGAQGPRADFATTASSALAIGSVLSGYESAEWFDASYFGGSGADVGSS